MPAKSMKATHAPATLVTAAIGAANKASLDIHTPTITAMATRPASHRCSCDPARPARTPDTESDTDRVSPCVAPERLIQARQVGRIDRPREVEPLRQVAPQAGQSPRAPALLDPLGNSAELPGRGQIDDARHDVAVSVLLQATDEGTVDLELVHRESLEIGEGRVPGAEVVDRETHAHVLQLMEPLTGRIDVDGREALRDLQDHVGRIDRVVLEHVGKLAREVGMLQLVDREVDTHVEAVPGMRSLVGLEGRAGLVEDELAERHDGPALLSNWDELIWRDHP